MASIRTPLLRHLTKPSPILRRFTQPQRRWAQVHDVRFLATTRPSQQILEKYQSKLDEKAKTEGFESIDQLKAAYSDQIQDLHKKDAKEYPIPQAPGTGVEQPNRGPLPSEGGGEGTTPGSIPQAPETPVTQPNVDPPSKDDPTIPQAPDTPVSQPNKDGPVSTPGSPASKAARRMSSSAEKQAVKGLDDYIDLEKSRLLSEKDLTTVWRLRHAKAPSKLSAVIPGSSYSAMEEAARSAPQFVLPMPHESQGAEIHFVQWTFDAPSRTSTVLFTHLAEYKMRGEFAQPHTTVTHHLDLLDDKGLVLMQGQVMDERGVQPEQAKWLVMCLQRFYGAWENGELELTGERKQRAEERKKLLNWFSTGDQRFTVEKLMEEAERMG